MSSTIEAKGPQCSPIVGYLWPVGFCNDHLYIFGREKKAVAEISTKDAEKKVEDEKNKNNNYEHFIYDYSPKLRKWGMPRKIGDKLAGGDILANTNSFTIFNACFLPNDSSFIFYAMSYNDGQKCGEEKNGGCCKFYSIQFNDDQCAEVLIMDVIDQDGTLAEFGEKLTGPIYAMNSSAAAKSEEQKCEQQKLFMVVDVEIEYPMQTPQNAEQPAANKMNKTFDVYHIFQLQSIDNKKWLWQCLTISVVDQLLRTADSSSLLDKDLIEMFNSTTASVYECRNIFCGSKKLIIFPTRMGIQLEKVLSFDIFDNTYRLETIAPDPLHGCPSNYFSSKLSVFDDKLFWPSECYFQQRDGENGMDFVERNEFWILDFNKMEWTRIFNAALTNSLWNYASTISQDGKFLYVVDGKETSEVIHQYEGNDCPVIELPIA